MRKKSKKFRVTESLSLKTDQQGYLNLEDGKVKKQEKNCRDSIFKIENERFGFSQNHYQLKSIK